jgi:osmotically-inducible protein OsmY
LLAVTVTEDRTASSQVSGQVLCALRHSGHHALSDVAVHAADGHVRLSGHVRSWFLKQRAQVAALSVAGDCRVINELIVRTPPRERGA